MYKRQGWYLPRKKQSYVDYLDSLLVNPKEIEKKDQLISQYYKLKDILQKYRDIEKKGGWSTIPIPSDFKSLRLGDTATIAVSYTHLDVYKRQPFCTAAAPT